MMEVVEGQTRKGSPVYHAGQNVVVPGGTGVLVLPD